MSERELGRSINFSSFAEWCEHKDSISEAAKRTVELLLNWTSSSDLDEVNRILSSRERLSLEEYQISDITPLQSLINLKYLDLHKNRISDITPLKSLINLKYLELRKNKISDITPLQSLINLTYLDLRYNPISDITTLQYLTNLTNWKLYYSIVALAGCGFVSILINWNFYAHR